jgi:hypothetical protein
VTFTTSITAKQDRFCKFALEPKRRRYFFATSFAAVVHGAATL